MDTNYQVCNLWTDLATFMRKVVPSAAYFIRLCDQPKRAWCRNTAQKYDTIRGLQDESIDQNPVGRVCGVRETTALVHTGSLRARTLLNDSYRAALSRGGWTQPSLTRATPLTAQTTDSGLVIASAVATLHQRCAIIYSVKTREPRRRATRGRGASPPHAGGSRGRLLTLPCPVHEWSIWLVASLLVSCGVLRDTRYESTHHRK